MAETMIASVNETMTDGQLDDLAAKLRVAARKHRDEFPRDAAQEALGMPNLGMHLLAAFRKLVEDISKQVIRIVTVDRARSPMMALKASGRKLYLNDNVVNAIPRRTGEKARLVYFKPGPECYKNGWLSCDALAAEYARRGLSPDPQAQIDDNAANPEFADTTPNACQWVDADGNYCYATCSRWLVERYVYVYRGDDDWNDDWWFAGVPQESSASAL